MPRTSFIWITSSPAISMWLLPNLLSSSFLWAPVSSFQQIWSVPPWVGVTQELWPRICHPGRPLQSSKRIGHLVWTWCHSIAKEWVLYLPHPRRWKSAKSLIPWLACLETAGKRSPSKAQATTACFALSLPTQTPNPASRRKRSLL